MTHQSLRSIWRRLLAEPGVPGALALLVGVTLVAILAPWITPYDPQRILDPVLLRSQAPSWAHPLGTDPYARDVLSRIMAGARSSLGLAAVAVALSAGMGTVVGVSSGVLGGSVDRLLMRIADVGLSIPRVLLILTVAGLWGGLSIPMLALLLGATGWMGLSRLVRSELLALRDHERVLAARALGLREWQIFSRHLLPEVVPFIAVAATSAFAQVLLLEAGLSFLGVGVPTPAASWGNVLFDVGDVIGPGRWIAVGPGVILAVTVLAVHRLGDAVQTVTDVHLVRNVT